jgi:hypothetical protein
MCRYTWPPDVQIHLATEEDKELTIPLKFAGTTIYFSSHTPTDKELQECCNVQFTSRGEWNPRNVQFAEPVERVEEGKLMQRVSVFQSNSQHCHCTHDEHGCDSCAYNANTALHLRLGVHGVVEQLIAGIQVADVKIAEVQATVVLDDVPTRRTFISKDRHPKITAEEFSKCWGIGLKQAANTICITT